jgi:hypothetical protein
MLDAATRARLNEEARATSAGTVVIDSERAAELDSIGRAGGIQSAPAEYLDRDDQITDLFCDTSGFGRPGEPALTQDQLERRLKELVREHGAIEIGITEFGQFQAHVGVWPISAEGG